MREGRLARTIRRDFLEEAGQSSTLNNRKGKEKEISFYFFSLLKYKFIYFNWRLITLQYFSGFAIHCHESAMGVHVPS